MEWIAKFQAKDESNRETIKVGIKKDRHLIGIYFDFDQDSAEMFAIDKEEAIQKIERNWNYMETYKRLD